MRKSYTFGIPFGLQRESGLFLDITEVSRGIDCNCICPACKTDLLAKQGEVKLWHFSHSTAVAGDCDGLMEAIRGKIIEVINEHQVLGFPNLLAGDDGGPVSLNEVSGSGSIVTNGAIVIHTQRLKSDPGGNLLS
ncbi:competence protein CoiA family protein [Escherichia coli]